MGFRFTRCCCGFGTLYVQWTLFNDPNTELWLTRVSPSTGSILWDVKLADHYSTDQVFHRGLAINSNGEAITCNGKIVSPEGEILSTLTNDVSDLVDTAATISRTFSDVVVDVDDKIYFQENFGSGTNYLSTLPILAAFRYSADGQTPEEWYAADNRSPDGAFSDGDENIVYSLQQITLDVGNLSGSNPALLTGGCRIGVYGGTFTDPATDIYAERYFEFATTGGDPVRQIASQYSHDIYDGDATYSQWRRSNTRSIRADYLGRAVFGGEYIYDSLTPIPGPDTPNFLGHLWCGSAGALSFVIDFSDGVWGESGGGASPIVECVRTGRRAEIYVVVYDFGSRRGPGVVDPDDGEQYSLFRIRSTSPPVLLWKLKSSEFPVIPAMDVDSSSGDCFAGHRTASQDLFSRLRASNGEVRWTTEHFADGLIHAVAHRAV